MPKFTITTDAGDGPETFDDPIEFPTIKAATDDAQVALVRESNKLLRMIWTIVFNRRQLLSAAAVG